MGGALYYIVIVVLLVGAIGVFLHLRKKEGAGK